MPKFSVTIVETVVVTYAPVVIEAATDADAINQVDALRCDGGLDDPENETVIDVAYKAVPSKARLRVGPEANPPLLVTDLGQEALAVTQAPCGSLPMSKGEALGKIEQEST